MGSLLRRPTGRSGLVHAITPEDAGWRYVGFDLWRLSPGEMAAGELEGREAILVLVEGRAEVTAGGEHLGELGGRMSVFERSPPHCVYIPPGTAWQARATTPCVIAVCSAPSPGGRPVQLLGPDGIVLEQRGTGTNARHINNIAMEGRDVADSLLVTEVFTPAGHWSSYPPHRHDEDCFPDLTYLEETYYHRLDPSGCFGFQRVFTDDLSLDETMAPADHDVVLVPKGHHPCAAPHGVEMYYLNVMAGPRRAWRFQTHPAFAHMVGPRSG
ncbi:5-deoxy-glucuronate isomerase [Natronohydrobacter thiooxidans]|uniref:5-deoxy-glucuronate isomerase n=1 Tax=Natronohydrobacter thiooxidans TaxID=87172 RepID=UPI0008FF1868|nr:5-deoxy-glucuronate isomerase [Natronohydrobacter thiooxidans]